jgi:hypothetical protein
VKGGKAIPPLLTLSFRSRGLLAKFMMINIIGELQDIKL